MMTCKALGARPLGQFPSWCLFPPVRISEEMPQKKANSCLPGPTCPFFADCLFSATHPLGASLFSHSLLHSFPW